MSDLPYNILSRQITIHLVYFAVLWLNSLPVAAGVSKKYSPHEIVLGRKLDFNKHCKATFGLYVEAHKDPTITNTMLSRTFPGIFLGPTGNRQGTHKVFNINTGVVKKTRIITPLPMPDRVIAMVEDWGRRHQKEDKKQALTFLNWKKKLYDWDNDNLKDDKGLVESDIAHPDLPTKFPGINLESEQPHHHQVVEVIEESANKHIYAVQCNVSLDDLPCRTTGVSTAVDEVQLDHWANPPDKNNLYHDIPMHPTLVVPPIPIHMTNIDDDDNATDNKTIDAEAAEMEEAVLGSTTIDGRRRSTCNRTPTRFTKVSFDNKYERPKEWELIPESRLNMCDSISPSVPMQITLGVLCIILPVR